MHESERLFNRYEASLGVFDPEKELGEYPEVDVYIIDGKEDFPSKATVVKNTKRYHTPDGNSFDDLDAARNYAAFCIERANKIKEAEGYGAASIDEYISIDPFDYDPVVDSACFRAFGLTDHSLEILREKITPLVERLHDDHYGKDLNDLFIKVKADTPATPYSLDVPYASINKAREAVPDLLRHGKSSIPLWENATEIEPLNPSNWINLAFARHEVGDFWGEIEACVIALTLDQENSVVWNDLGLAYSNAGEMQLSINAARRAVKLDPRSIGYWYNLGKACHKADQLEEAEKAYKKALEINPDHAEVLNELAQLYE